MKIGNRVNIWWKFGGGKIPIETGVIEAVNNNEYLIRSRDGTARWVDEWNYNIQVLTEEEKA